MIKLLFFYIKEKFQLILFITFILTIFISIFKLYNQKIEIEAIIYSVILIFLFGFIITIFDFTKYYANYKKLNFIYKYLFVSNPDFSKSSSKKETLYQEIIIKLLSEHKKNKELEYINKSNMIDYYTLWVHQIKTPISALSLLLQNNIIDKTKLEQELFKVNQYVEMVLSYIRLTSDSTDYIIEPINLDSCVKSTLKKYSNIFITKKISVNYLKIKQYPISDEKWLTFALEQIISNALKYTNKNGSIKIYFENNSLIIEDNGIGIKSSDLPRLFDKGFTGFNGRYEKKSSGLGLYLTKKILDNLGHDINISSDENIGTKVAIHFSKKLFL